MKLTLTLLFFLVVECIAAQPTTEDVLSKMVDKPAKEESNIFLYKIPEWHMTYPRLNLGVSIYKNAGDCHMCEDLVFASQQYPQKGSTIRSLSTYDLTWSEKGTGRNMLLDGFNDTHDPALYVKLLVKPGDWDNLLFESVKFKGPQDYDRKKLDKTAFLSSIGESGAKIENMMAIQTQNMDHIFVDVWYIKNELEGDFYWRRWVILDALTLEPVRNIKVPRSNSRKGLYLTFAPILDLDPKIFQRRGFGTNGVKTFESPLCRPGVDHVYARFRVESTFWDSRYALIKVDMKTGEVAYVAPPKESMKRSASTFIGNNVYKTDPSKFPDPMWNTNLQEERALDYELFVYYSEKDQTYMTMTSIYIGSGAQLVMQNRDGEYFDRIEGRVPVNVYRIRKMETNEILTEYAIMSSFPLRISQNAKYMVLVEGTRNNQILTVRDRYTGRRINKGPVHRNGPLLIETKKGFFSLADISHTEVGLSWLKFPNN